MRETKSSWICVSFMYAPKVIKCGLRRNENEEGRGKAKIDVVVMMMLMMMIWWNQGLSSASPLDVLLLRFSAKLCCSVLPISGWLDHRIALFPPFFEALNVRSLLFYQALFSCETDLLPRPFSSHLSASIFPASQPPPILLSAQTQFCLQTRQANMSAITAQIHIDTASSAGDRNFPATPIPYTGSQEQLLTPSTELRIPPHKRTKQATATVKLSRRNGCFKSQSQSIS